MTFYHNDCSASTAYSNSIQNNRRTPLVKAATGDQVLSAQSNNSVRAQISIPVNSGSRHMQFPNLEMTTVKCSRSNFVTQKHPRKSFFYAVLAAG